MGAEHAVASPFTLASTIKLRNGAQMPRLGFGAYQLKNGKASAAHALAMGYRHIDSARMYYNEDEVCFAVNKFSEHTPNEGTGKVWLTTKVTGSEHGTAKTAKAVDQSAEIAKKYGLKWDLFLLHDPTAGKEKRLEAWKVLLEKRDQGVIRTAGVSNFGVKHLEQIKEAGLEMPEVNQIELHPFLQQKPIVEYCQKHDIVIEAYCPILRGQRFDDETLQKVSKKHDTSVAQVLIRWSLQKGYVPLPKSDTPARIQANADLFDFELDKDDMAALDALDEGKPVSWNPVNVD
ncbi:aldo/keto reductase [Rhodotorula paludigena]|uniref:aldo/keto reductase n=1 Tax=Rhodotorula paludigena TaxID=86838 RepID=UPI00316E0B9A